MKVPIFQHILHYFCSSISQHFVLNSRQCRRRHVAIAPRIPHLTFVVAFICELRRLAGGTQFLRSVILLCFVVISLRTSLFHGLNQTAVIVYFKIKSSIHDQSIIPTYTWINTIQMVDCVTAMLVATK